jgi:hypothetical protein
MRPETPTAYPPPPYMEEPVRRGGVQFRGQEYYTPTLYRDKQA